LSLRSFYAPAQEACAASLEKLKSLDLTGEEAALLEIKVEPSQIVDKLLEIQAQLENDPTRRSKALKKASSFINGFCNFASKTSNIVMVLIPQSPEYTVTIGMIFLLFKVRRPSSVIIVTFPVSNVVSRLLGRCYKERP
jgi:hypothetical protein